MPSLRNIVAETLFAKNFSLMSKRGKQGGISEKPQNHLHSAQGNCAMQANQVSVSHGNLYDSCMKGDFPQQCFGNCFLVSGLFLLILFFVLDTCQLDTASIL